MESESEIAVFTGEAIMSEGEFLVIRRTRVRGIKLYSGVTAGTDSQS